MLERLLGANRDTVFGKQHGFSGIRSAADYARQVPLGDYEAVRPYVDRIAAGEDGVLTAEPTVMFTTTSGTTNLPKLIPVTTSWREEMSSLTRLWMLRAARDHPRCFDHRIFYLASPAVEGWTPRGLPFGALTGVIYKRIPWVVRQQYSLPYAASILADPDARYFVDDAAGARAVGVDRVHAEPDLSDPARARRPPRDPKRSSGRSTTARWASRSPRHFPRAATRPNRQPRRFWPASGRSPAARATWRAS